MRNGKSSQFKFKKSLTFISFSPVLLATQAGSGEGGGEPMAEWREERGSESFSFPLK